MSEIQKRKAWNRQMLNGLRYLSSPARAWALRQIEINLGIITDGEG